MSNLLKVGILLEGGFKIHKVFCNDELVAITNGNAMLKQQARYLVKRRQPELLWAQVLVGGNIHRCQLMYCFRSTFDTIV
jgi:hypothetical protein